LEEKIILEKLIIYRIAKQNKKIHPKIETIKTLIIT
jgi:hypothetical protein